MNAAGDNRRAVFGLMGTKTTEFSTASYKKLPMTIENTSKLDFYHSNVNELRTHCDNCFPLLDQFTPTRGPYVDLLDFSLFNGRPYPLCESVQKPSRWFADIRYTLSTPLVHSYPPVTKEVLTSTRVGRTIERIAKESSNPNSQLSSTGRAKQFFFEIRAKLSTFVCKICAYVLYKVFRRLMSKLLVSPDEIERVQKTELTGVPMVYLPLHKSHLDYLLITWCNWHFGLKLPHIASGDNLNLSGLGWLLRATGAFFIRRRVNPDDEGGKDALYRAVLHSYIEQVMKKDMPIEFFLEGTRSRFGKALVPKNGLISNVVEAVQQGTIKDCYLVPVSYTYDAVVEGIFLNELMGVPKVRESVLGVFKAIFQGFRQSKQCGNVRMHYGRPVLLSDYLSSLRYALGHKRAPPSTLSRLPNSFSYRELVPWHHTHSAAVDDRALIRAIGFHAVYEAQRMISTSLVSIVSCLLLGKFRKGVDRKELENDAQWLCDAVIADGGEVMGYRSRETSGAVIVDYALEKIGGCVDFDENKSFVRPVSSHRQRIHLAYNKNALVARFAIKAAVALSIVCRKWNEIHRLDELVEDALSVCDWMQFEVIFCRPCDDLRGLIHEVLSENVWASPHGGPLIANCDDFVTFEGGDGHQTSTIMVRDGRSFEMLMFFANLLRPFVQSLYVVSRRVATDEEEQEKLTEGPFIRQLCKDALAHRLNLPFDPLLESINSDSFKNAIRILRQKGFLDQDVTRVVRNRKTTLQEVLANLERMLTVYQF